MPVRELTDTEKAYMDYYVDLVRQCGGVKVTTRQVHALIHPADKDSPYTRQAQARKISKAFQKAAEYGYLDIEWTGKQYLVTLPNAEVPE
jgi:hypothetical protein